MTHAARTNTPENATADKVVIIHMGCEMYSYYFFLCWRGWAKYRKEHEGAPMVGLLLAPLYAAFPKCIHIIGTRTGIELPICMFPKCVGLGAKRMGARCHVRLEGEGGKEDFLLLLLRKLFHQLLIGIFSMIEREPDITSTQSHP